MTNPETLHHGTCTCDYDVAAWHRRYAPQIHSFTLARTGDPMAAEDCTSETFLRALSGRNSFTCRGNGVAPWLFTIARNIVLDYGKKAYRRVETPAAVIDDWVSYQENPENTVLRAEAQREVLRYIDELPRDQATVLRLRFFEDLTVRQTAQVMQRSEQAVRTLQYRAIRKLARRPIGEPFNGAGNVVR